MLPKNYIVHLQKLMDISIRMSTSASEDEISYASIRRSKHVFTLKLDEQICA